MPLDKTSIDTLQKVRRGAPARFVLLTKGIRLLSLVVYRKGTLESAKKLAKEAGTGEISFGVVTGQDANIVFQLARADGFEKVPTRDLTVKAHLAESNLDFKPTVVLVDVLPDVAMDDEGGNTGGPNTNAPNTNLSNSQRPPQSPPPPTPPRTNAPPPSNRPVYRTAEQWKTLLQEIQNTADPDEKARRINQTVADIRDERTQMDGDSLFAGDPNAKREQTDLHRTIGEALKRIATTTTTQSTTTTQPPPRPKSEPPRNLPPQRNLETPEDAERRMQIADAARREQEIAQLPKFTAPFTKKQLQDLVAACETDVKSDFGIVCGRMMLNPKEDFETIKLQLENAREAAAKYIKDHADPKIGKLPSRVVKRREECVKFQPIIERLYAELTEVDKKVAAMVETYSRLLEKGQQVPFAVADSLRRINADTKLSKGTRAELLRVASAIQAAEQPRGYEKLAQLDNPTDDQRAELMLRYGCFKDAGGGTSDVRLLRNQDRSIAFAFKRVDGEAFGALDMLKLPNGACATREDLCSSMTETILKQTGLNLGFPKSKVSKFDGVSGALIEGIRGKTVDPEERRKYSEMDPPDPEGLAEIERNIQELPEKITAKSLQKVVLFSTITCQWDCKWGNLMVEGEDNARPLDGGAAFPSQAVVDDFAKDYRVRHRPIAILALTQYPRTPLLFQKAGQTLPNAEQPMDAETVEAILKIDVASLKRSTQERRDEIARTNPELAPPGHEQGLVDDGTLDRVAASIRATQDILRANPQMSLVQFATAYQDWWVGWIESQETKAGR